MASARVVDLTRRVGESAALKGWVRTIRRHKKVSFLELNDGSTFGNLQVVCEGQGPLQPVVDGLTIGCSVELEGTVSEHRGSVELHATALAVTGECPQDDYPLQKKEHSLEFLRQHPNLRARTKTLGGALRVRHALSRGLRAFFDERDFVGVSTPIMTPSDCEGAGELFIAERAELVLGGEDGAAAPGAALAAGGGFFGEPMFLTVSGQMEAEMFACALGRVYTFGPAFRAENSSTSRHLAEFWMLEPEVAWTTLPELLDLAEDAVRHAVATAQSACGEEMAYFAARSQSDRGDGVGAETAGGAAGGGGGGGGGGGASSRASAVDVAQQHALLADGSRSFARMSYSEAIAVLQRGDLGAAQAPQWGDDLSSAHERFLTELHCGGTPLFVTDWPRAIKPFYMRANDASAAEQAAGRDTTFRAGRDTVACFDLIVPGVGELAGGGMREERYEPLRERMVAANLLPSEDAVNPEVDDPERSAGGGKSAAEEYLELRKFGSVPHGGFGLGFERLVQYATGLGNIRDVIPVPRAAAHGRAAAAAAAGAKRV